MKADVFQDWKINRGSTKSQVIMVAFRSAQWAQRSLPRPAGSVVSLGYKVLTTWILGVELPPETSVGRSLRILHPQAITVNAETVIGDRCTIRSCTTFGNVVSADGKVSNAPVIGDDVEFGTHVVVIGGIAVGDGARVGAGAVVIKDVPAGAVAVGNPARILEPAADSSAQAAVAASR